jgi:hypothetical protein
MIIAEILQDLTFADEFSEKLRCQSELLAGLWVDKPSTYILGCISKGDDFFKVNRFSNSIIISMNLKNEVIIFVQRF